MRQTFGGVTGEIGRGEIRYEVSMRGVHKAQREYEANLRDPPFRAVDGVLRRMSAEIKYDYRSAYGLEVKYRRPPQRLAVCSGYASRTAAYISADEDARRHVARVYVVSGDNHAWNELELRDGRLLFADATWYQGQGVDGEGYLIENPECSAVDITFDRETFETLGGAIDLATKRLLRVHVGERGEPVCFD